MDTNGRKWGRDPPEIRGPKSEVGGPKTGRNGLHPVILLFPVFLLGCGFLSFGGPKIPICVNLRSFAVVGGLKTRISAGKQEIFTKTGEERSVSLFPGLVLGPEGGWARRVGPTRPTE